MHLIDIHVDIIMTQTDYKITCVPSKILEIFFKIITVKAPQNCELNFDVITKVFMIFHSFFHAILSPCHKFESFAHKFCFKLFHD